MAVGVSIIIPCYNYGRFLGHAIESALAQTIRPQEVIVVNDGSIDDTAQVAGRYPVTLITQVNQGPSMAFNQGVRASHGELFALLSADDLLHPRFLEYALPPLLNDPAIAFTFTHAVTFGKEHSILINQEYDLTKLGRGGFMGGGCLMRRKAFDSVGGFDPALRHGEDWDLWLGLAEQSYFGRLVPRILFAYRKHGSGLAEKNPLLYRWSALIYLHRKHPRLLHLRPLARLGAYDILFILTTQARRLTPRGYEWLRQKMRSLRPRLGGVERYRTIDPNLRSGLGYDEMLRFLDTMGQHVE